MRREQDDAGPSNLSTWPSTSGRTLRAGHSKPTPTSSLTVAPRRRRQSDRREQHSTSERDLTYDTIRLRERALPRGTRRLDMTATPGSTEAIVRVSMREKSRERMRANHQVASSRESSESAAPDLPRVAALNPSRLPSPLRDRTKGNGGAVAQLSQMLRLQEQWRPPRAGRAHIAARRRGPGGPSSTVPQFAPRYTGCGLRRHRERARPPATGLYPWNPSLPPLARVGGLPKASRFSTWWLTNRIAVPHCTRPQPGAMRESSMKCRRPRSGLPRRRAIPPAKGSRRLERASRDDPKGARTCS